MKTKGMVLNTAVMVIVPLLLLVSILGAPFAKVYATGTVLGIESAEDVEAGSVFILSIYLDNAIKTTGIGLDLTWDPAVLKLLEVTIDPLSPAGSYFPAPPSINNIEGSMTLGLVNNNPLNYITVIEKTPIIDLKLEAVGSPGDSTILNLENVELSDEDFNLYFPDIVTDGFVSMRAQYPVIISLGETERVFFAAHTDNLEDGNWIELDGGTPIELPSMSAVYTGPEFMSYGGVTVTMDSSFIPDLTYPLSTHQVYGPGQLVSATFWGSTEFADKSVRFRLFKASSFSEIRDDVLNKDIGGIIDTLLNIEEWSQKITLDLDGDATHSFNAPAVGDYLLLVSKIEDFLLNPKVYIYSATAIEVVDYTLDVSAASSVVKGTDLSIEATLSGDPSGSYIYGFAMIDKSSYYANIRLESTGTIPSTELYLNGELMADGNLFTDFFTGTKDQSDLNITLIEDRLTKVFDPGELSFAHSTTGSMSLSTSLLIPGDYVLLVGAWKDFETRIVGVYQKNVMVTSLGLPVANAGGPYSGKPGVAINFDGSGSYDIDGSIISYDWTFGDGGTGTGVSPSHTYTADGVYPVTLTVTDDDGLTDTDDTTNAKISTPSPPPYFPPIITNKPPVAEAGPNQTVYVGDMTHLSGVGSYDPDGTIVYYKWDLGDGTTASGMNVSHAYSEPGIYTATLTVGDDRMVYGYDTCTITVLETIPLPPLPPILSNLTITPPELERGDNVTISLDIENIDSQSFTYIVTMHIENVNDPPPTWPPYHLTLLVDVELGAYESKTVSHTITMDAIGDFNVTVDGLTGSFKVGTWPPEPPLKPAEFVVSDLTIEPEEVTLEEGINDWTFEITVDVKNVGEQEGTHTVDLKIDGDVIQTGTVTLWGGEETSITFDVTRGVGVYAVEIAEITGSFEVKPYLAPLKPAEFVVSDVALAATEIEPGGTIIVSVIVANIGETEGTYTVELKVDGETVESESVTLAGGASQEVNFPVSSDEEGEHTVKIDGISGSFTVKSPPPKKPIWPSIILVVAVVAVLVYLIWVRTDWIQQLIKRMGIDGDVHQELP